MRYLITITLIAALLFPVTALAKQEAKAGKSTVQPLSSSGAKQKEVLINDINNLRNQEVRIIVIQQLLNEEVAKFRKVQDVFCDRYKLDAEKFRKGTYRYDEQQSKFVEVAPGK